MKVEAIYYYPIKSLRGVSVPSARLTRDGFPYDRRFMLLRDHGSVEANAKAANGTQYEALLVGKMALLCMFSTELADERTVRVTFVDPKTSESSRLEIPLEPDIAALERIRVNLHQAETNCYRMPQSDWFGARLGFPVCLAYIGRHRREVLGNLAPNAAQRNPIKNQAASGGGNTPQSTFAWLSGVASSLIGGGGGGSGTARSEGEENDDDDDYYRMGFADCAPYLVASTKSLDELSARLDNGHPMDITKLRPNILVTGADAAFDEDFWAQLEVRRADGRRRQEKDGAAAALLHLTSNCARCPSITVDYTTGRFGSGPSGDALKLLQRDRRVDRGMPYSPVFGRYGFLEAKAEGEGERGRGGGEQGCVIAVGDEVEVVKRNAERTKFLYPGIGVTKKDDRYPV